MIPTQTLRYPLGLRTFGLGISGVRLAKVKGDGKDHLWLAPPEPSLRSLPQLRTPRALPASACEDFCCDGKSTLPHKQKPDLRRSTQLTRTS